MRIAPLLLALGGLAACSSTATTPPPATSAAATPGASTDIAAPAPSTAPLPGPTSAAPALAADGKHFAVDTSYQGECAPAGSRGGCYTFLFHPDGRAEHVLLDARDTGTYRIEGNAIIYRSATLDAKDERFESTDGFRTLSGNYRFTP